MDKKKLLLLLGVPGGGFLMLILPVLLIAGFFFGSPTTPGPKVPLSVTRWRPLVNHTRACHATGLSPDLVLAVIEQESGGDPSAVSSAGAVGLMQVEPTPGLKDEREWRWVTTGKGRHRHRKKVMMPEEKIGQSVKADLLQPKTSLHWGCTMLSDDMASEKGDLPKALAAYNAGVGAVARFTGGQNFRQTNRYVVKVLSDEGRIKASVQRKGGGHGAS